MKKRNRSRMAKRQIRFTEKEMKRIQLYADLYAGGNFSKWVRYAAMNAERRILVDAGE